MHRKYRYPKNKEILKDLMPKRHLCSTIIPFLRKFKAHRMIAQKPLCRISTVVSNKKNMLFAHIYLGSLLKRFLDQN